MSQACQVPGSSAFRLAYKLYPTDPYRFTSVRLDYSVQIDPQSIMTDALVFFSIVEGW